MTVYELFQKARKSMQVYNVYKRILSHGHFITQEHTQFVGIVEASSHDEANTLAKRLYGQSAYADGFYKDSGEIG